MRIRAKIVAGLVKRQAERDVAAQYADAYLEYHEACEKIQDGGRVVAHPVTGGPIINPHIEIRDKALVRLQAMKDTYDIEVDWLW